MVPLLMYWEETHRALLWGIIAASFWIGTYWIYLRYDIRKYLSSRRPARWGVDMASRTVTSGRKPVV